jgi:hypothetical protein
MAIIHKTLLLDTEKSDLVLDANGDIALADTPYAIAQDVATAIKTFPGDCWYDQTLGLPYFENILGEFPPLQYVSQRIIDAALSVPNISSVQLAGLDLSNRKLTGQVQIIDIDGASSGVTF